MNLILLTAMVVELTPIVREGGSIKYFFKLQIDESFEAADGSQVERIGIIEASGTPKTKHRERWSYIQLGDELYIKGSLMPTLDGDIFLHIYDLGLTYHPEDEAQIEMVGVPCV